MAGVTSAGPSQFTPWYGAAKLAAGSLTVYGPSASPVKRNDPSSAVTAVAATRPSRTASTVMPGSPFSPGSMRPGVPAPPGAKSR